MKKFILLFFILFTLSFIYLLFPTCQTYAYKGNNQAICLNIPRWKLLLFEKFNLRIDPEPSKNLVNTDLPSPTFIPQDDNHCIPTNRKLACTDVMSYVWHFDAEKRECYQPHGGCPGTRFDTKGACEQACLK